MILYQADCRHIIPMLDYDSVVTDPWYGASSETDVRKPDDGYAEWCLSWFDLLKKPIAMTVGKMNFSMWCRIRDFDDALVWHKPDGMEPVLGWGVNLAPDGKTSWFKTGPEEVDAKGYRAKPLEWAVEMVSRVPGKVLDPFMGKGVVGLACKKLGREFIGIEHDPEIFKVARERLR